MSYDVSIGSDAFNITYNVGKLFYDHIPADRDRGGLRALDGLTGRQAADVLRSAFERIDNSVLRHWTVEAIGEPKFCALYDAPNGWGSAVGGLVFLARLMAACHGSPRSKVRVS